MKDFFKGLLITVAVIAVSFSMTACGDDTSDTTVITFTHQTLSDGDILSGTFGNGATVTIDANATVSMEGLVKFQSGSILIINEGVTVEGVLDANNTAYLIIDQGALIYALGTEDAPITFTSDQADGSRGQQDWGGIVINGKAPVNVSNPSGEGDSGTYGGDDKNDNSGILNYVRVYFAGKDASSTDQLNGIAFQGVGDGTEVDYVLINNCKDDGVEFFGGTVNVSHIVSAGNGDDQFDWTEGWKGTASYIALALVEGNSDDPRGIEGDNLEDDNDATPRSTVSITNLTILVSDNSWDDDGARIRRGSDVTIKDAYIANDGAAGTPLGEGIKVTEASTALSLENVLIEGFTDGDQLDAGDGATVADNVDQIANVITANDGTATYYYTMANFASLTALEAAGDTAFVPGTDLPGTAGGAMELASAADNWLDTWGAFFAD